MLNKVVIVGVGLIGAAFALALKRGNGARTVIGIDRDAATLAQALACGAIDRQGSMADANDADLVVLAVPVRQMGNALLALRPFIAAHTLIIDVGSTKQDVCAAARAALDVCAGQFVPCHPIAGGERHGPLAAHAEMFVGKNVVMTPLAENFASNIQAVADIWRQLGAHVIIMTAAAHDAVFAAVSHLPHMLAFALVDELASRPNARVFFEHAASGFRDFTRIASSSPEMWRDVALNNRDALLTELDAFLARAARLRQSLAEANDAELFAMMQRAQQARAQWLTGQLDHFRDDAA